MSDPQPSRTSGGRPRRWIVVLGIVLAGALLALMVFLHLSGTVGPGVH